MVVPLTIGRPSATKLVDSELPENKQLGLVTQRDEQLDRPEPSDLFRIGVSAQVRQVDPPTGRRDHLDCPSLETYRAGIVRSNRTLPPRRCAHRQYGLPEGDDTELQASFNNLRRSALRLLELSPEIPDQARAALIGVEQPEQLTDLLAGNLGIDLATKQRILEETRSVAPDANSTGSASTPT